MVKELAELASRINSAQEKELEFHISQMKREYHSLELDERFYFLQGLVEVVKNFNKRNYSMPLNSKKRTCKKNLAFNYERAREVRKQTGLSLKNLAEKLGCENADNATSLLSDYERGVITPCNPPKGKVSRAYVEWLVSQGYNPYKLESVGVGELGK